MEKKKTDSTIDNILNDLLKRIPQLKNLDDTGLYLEKESIDNLSSNLDKMLAIQVENNECEYLDFWEIVFPPLIIHALRYLEFRHLEYQQDFTLAREIILDGHLDSLEEMEVWCCPSIDARQIIKLIDSCWLPIKESDFYSAFHNVQILEIIRDIRFRIKGYNNIDLQKNIEKAKRKSIDDEIIKDSLTNTIQSLKKNKSQEINLRLIQPKPKQIEKFTEVILGVMAISGESKKIQRDDLTGQLRSLILDWYGCKPMIKELNRDLELEKTYITRQYLSNYLKMAFPKD